MLRLFGTGQRELQPRWADAAIPVQFRSACADGLGDHLAFAALSLTHLISPSTSPCVSSPRRSRTVSRAAIGNEWKQSGHPPLRVTGRGGVPALAILLQSSIAQEPFHGAYLGGLLFCGDADEHQAALVAGMPLPVGGLLAPSEGRPYDLGGKGWHPERRREF